MSQPTGALTAVPDLLGDRDVGEVARAALGYDPAPQRGAWRVSLYRDDSETTVVLNDVKSVFMTCDNSVLTIAQYAADGSHHYVNWPRERLCWWKVERA